MRLGTHLEERKESDSLKLPFLSHGLLASSAGLIDWLVPRECLLELEAGIMG